MKLELRPVTPEKECSLRTLAVSRTQPVRLVQRGRLLMTMLDDPTVSTSAASSRAGLSGQSGVLG